MKCSSLLQLLLISLLILSCNSTGEQAKEKPNPSPVAATPQAESPSTPKKKAVLPKWPAKYQSQKTKSHPFDEGPSDPGFAAFRDQFYQAVADRDHKTLLSFVDEQIKFSFGAENGKADFMTAWELDKQPKASRIWAELEKVLRLGGAFGQYKERVFMAPWLFVIDDIDDPYETGVIIGENVRLREQPSSMSKVLGSMTYDKVKMEHSQHEPIMEKVDGEEFPWVPVTTAGGMQGFVFGKFVRTPVDFRAVFGEKDGQWRMISFIAGD